MTTPSDRLTSLLAEPGRELDRLMAIVATVASDAPSEDTVVEAFDELAEPVSSSAGTGSATPEAVLSYLFGEVGFIGNTTNYFSPSNSLVHRVLTSRKGIPLTLAAIAVEVGRRVGVELTVVGLPGHVILGDGERPSRWFDPFGGGAELNVDDCRRIFARFSPIESFAPAFLNPIDRTAIASRMLNNLKASYRGLSDLSQLAKVLNLSVCVPGALVSERHELAVVLAALGRDELAAAQRDLLVELEPDRADAHRAIARRHRARRN